MAEGATLDTMGTAGSVLLGLIAVVGVIFLCAWLLRRMQGLPGGQTRAMKVLSVLSVGQRERVALIEVGGTQILLGITPHSVRTLHVFDEPVIARPDTGGGGDFASRLQSILSRGGPGQDSRTGRHDAGERGE